MGQKQANMITVHGSLLCMDELSQSSVSVLYDCLYMARAQLRVGETKEDFSSEVQ